MKVKFKFLILLVLLVMIDLGNAASPTTDKPPIVYSPSTGAVPTPAGSPYNFPSTTKIGSISAPASSRVATQFDKASNTTLANVTGLSITVAASKTYAFRAVLHVTLDATGLGKVAIAGTATATSVVYYTLSNNENDPGGPTNARQTALAGATSFGDAGNKFATIDGTITVNAGGTLTVQFAQASASGTSSVLVGSTFTAWEIP